MPFLDNHQHQHHQYQHQHHHQDQQQYQHHFQPEHEDERNQFDGPPFMGNPLGGFVDQHTSFFSSFGALDRSRGPEPVPGGSNAAFSFFANDGAAIGTGATFFSEPFLGSCQPAFPSSSSFCGDPQFCFPRQPSPQQPFFFSGAGMGTAWFSSSSSLQAQRKYHL